MVSFWEGALLAYIHYNYSPLPDFHFEDVEAEGGEAFLSVDDPVVEYLI